jgi:hypothetical protein
MNFLQVVGRVEKVLRTNSPAILTALGVSGTITTAYLAGKASFRAAEAIQKEALVITNEPKNRKKDIKLVWKSYIPTAVSGAVTITCIICATRIGMKRTAAITAAYSLSEKAFSEYRDKVIDKVGERKEQQVRDDIAQDKVRANAPSREVVLSGSGHILCCELYTGRYFNSDMESLRKAQNDLNARLVNHVYATLDDFYYMIGLPQTSSSGNIGWNSDKLMELRFSTVLTDDGRPCLAFEYNYTKPL